MMNQAALFSLLALAQSAAALPRFSDFSIRQFIGTTPPPAYLTKSYCPVVHYSDAVDGKKWQTGNSAGSGSSLSIGASYTQGTSFTIGADLGMFTKPLLKGITATGGVSFSYTESVSKTVIIGASENCPKKKDGSEADYSCSLIVTPGFVKIGGEVVEISSIDKCEYGITDKPGKWEIIVPRTDAGGNPFYYADKCLCDGPGQDQENAPELKCLEACTGTHSG